MKNFLTKHIINRIKKEVIDLNVESKNSSFLFFDENIVEDNYIINRVTTEYPYQLEEVLPISWYALKGTTLIKIHNKLKERKVYVPLHINGITYKVKIDEIS